MSRILSVLMNKGGVGKTSLVTNLACALALEKPEKKVLIVDTDGQGNAAMAFGLNPNDLKPSIYDCLLEGLDPHEVITPIEKLGMKNLYILPANSDLKFFGFDVLTHIDRFPNISGLLKNVIDQIKAEFDFIFIDTPPHIELMAMNVLEVSDDIYIPFVPETFAVQGLMQVVETIREFQKEREINAKIAGVIGMMIDSRTSLHNDLMIQADAYCKYHDIPMMKTRIPRTIRFADSTAAFGVPLVLANPKSQISKIYFDLLKEVIQE